jgi:predicted transposase/invertase (TIGR01784 family)
MENNHEEENNHERFISILSDYGFKVTFGNESDTRFLKKALQALIKSPVAIKEVTFVQNEMKGLSADGRGGIYDIACTDENGNYFIVEMQLSIYPEFIQRLKFYALYRFNTFVKKGQYTFENLPKIYCIGILADNIFSDIDDYHNIAVLKNEKGELIDDQMSFITVELEKFDLEEVDCQTDLQKLIFTMKNLGKISEPTQFPEFWNEEWLNIAIKELDTRALTPEEHLIYEMTIAKNAVIVRKEDKKLREAIEKATEIATEKATKKATEITNLVVKTQTVKNALLKGLDVHLVAEIADTSIEFVKNIQQELLLKNKIQ